MIIIPHYDDGLNLNYLALLACIVAHDTKNGKKCLKINEAVRIISKGVAKHD